MLEGEGGVRTEGCAVALLQAVKSISFPQGGQ